MIRNHGSFPRTRISLALALALSTGALMLGSAHSLIAQTSPPPEAPEPVLPDRPDRAGPGGAQNLLGEPFESPAAGIWFRAPAKWKEERRHGGSEVVQFTNEQKGWTLSVNRLTFNPPVEMTYHKVPNPDGKGVHDVNGLFEETIENLKTDSPGIQIDHADISQAGGLDVGMIAARVASGGEDNLTLVALLRASPADATKSNASSVYYSFNLNAPVPRGAKLDDDAEVRRVVETFNQVLETVRLLDQTEIRSDQDNRLFRTRSLFVNMTEARIRKVMIPEQWLRLIREGKDVGYMYIVEEVGQDIPRNGQAAPRGTGPDGLLVGVRSRTMPPSGEQIDVASWSWAAFDRQGAKWTSIAAVRSSGNPVETYTEIGSMQVQKKLLPEPGLEKGEMTKSGVDAEQPAVRQTEVRSLDVYFKGKEHAGAPINQKLPPWYLPQPMLQVLPRLIANVPDKTYMFAAYNTDARAVMTRYVDVGHEQTVDIGGHQVNAIPVDDRWGLEGSVTTHFITRDGKYLGSVNKDSKIVILPTDRPTLEKLWQNADISRPKEVEGK